MLNKKNIKFKKKNEPLNVFILKSDIEKYLYIDSSVSIFLTSIFNLIDFVFWVGML